MFQELQLRPKNGMFVNCRHIHYAYERAVDSGFGANMFNGPEHSR